MTDYYGIETPYILQLIIDGCNGPIRFRQSLLNKAVETTIETKHIVGNSSKNEPKKVSSVNDDDGTTLSFLRPDSIKSLTASDKLCNSIRPKKNKNVRRNKSSKTKACISADTARLEESTNRLDMIPLLEKLLTSSTLGEEEMRSNTKRLFNSISVIFDGISITKRPSIPVSKNSDQSRQEDEANKEDIDRGRHWCVTNDTANSKTVVVASGNGLYDKMDKSGHLVIEITGLYDEADNVIVERIQEHHRRNIVKESTVQRERPLQTTDADAVNIRSIAAATRIQILRRTERGAGKNRRLFQSLGLLRPESVACIFEFCAPMETTKIDSEEEKSEHECEHFPEYKQTRFSSLSSFRRLALDGDQTLRSVRRHNPGNVFVALEEPLNVSHTANVSNRSPLVIPIVATDDVFLRQRIVHEGGFVMTFHQLWLLLIDVV